MNELKKPLSNEKRLCAPNSGEIPTDERIAILMGQAALAEGFTDAISS